MASPNYLENITSCPKYGSANHSDLLVTDVQKTGQKMYRKVTYFVFKITKNKCEEIKYFHVMIEGSSLSVCCLVQRGFRNTGTTQASFL